MVNLGTLLAPGPLAGQAQSSSQQGESEDLASFTSLDPILFSTREKCVVGVVHRHS